MTDMRGQTAAINRLAHLLIAVTGEVQDVFAGTVAEFGISAHLSRALVLLSEPAPMRDLAEQLGVDRSYITGLTDQLEERGMVTRVPGKDRRTKLLTLTEEGMAFRTALADAVAQRSPLFLRLTQAERDALEPILEHLLADPSRIGQVRPAEEAS